MQPVVGASLLSAAASLPVHLMPFLVTALVGESRLPLAQAGWVASAFMAGQLAASLALPAMGVSALRARHALLAATALACLPWLTREAAVSGLLGSWFIVGLACGALQFLGATTAAAAPDKPRAFALRLGAILLVSSVVIAAAVGSAGPRSYRALTWQLCVPLAALCGVGLALYRQGLAPPEPLPRPAPPGRAAPWRGLAAVFLVFAAQPGFWVYAVLEAQGRGISLQDLAYAVAACKALSVLVLLTAMRHARPVASALLWPGLAVSAGVLVMTGANGLAGFAAGVLLWELAVNLLSVRFQAAVVASAGGSAGPWLAAATFLGAAAGPVLHGLAIQAEMAGLFIAFACAAGLVPYVWSLQEGQRARVRGA